MCKLIERINYSANNRLLSVISEEKAGCGDMTMETSGMQVHNENNAFERLPSPVEFPSAATPAKVISNFERFEKFMLSYVTPLFIGGWGMVFGCFILHYI